MGSKTRATISMKVSPAALLLTLVKRCGSGLRFVLHWLRGDKPKKLLGEAHRGAYEALRRRFGLSSKVAIDCYRNAVIYN